MKFNININELAKVESFDEFKNKIEKIKEKDVNIEKLVENYMPQLTKIINKIPEKDAINCYIYLADNYCDGTEKKYNKWLGIIDSCIKNKEVPKKQKENLMLLD